MKLINLIRSYVNHLAVYGWHLICEAVRALAIRAIVVSLVILLASTGWIDRDLVQRLLPYILA
jgi:hypothetical protein